MHETIIQLRAAEAKYRGIFENAIEGIYQSTPTGRYLAINSALAKMYGYESPEDMMDQVSDIQNQIYVDPSFRKRFRDEIESTGVVRALEYQVRRRDGSIIWISESARTVWETDGSVLYYEGFIMDISKRKRAEASLAELQHRQERILTSVGEGLLGINQDGKIFFENPAAASMLGWGVEELIGKSSHEVIYHTRADGSPNPIEKSHIHATLQDGVVRRVEDEVYWRKDGASIPVVYTCTPIRDETGGTVGTIVAFRDVTERKQRDAEREKLIVELQTALAEIKTLSGMIPICGWCKSIRTDQGFWQSVEQFVHARTDATISHGICPSCVKKIGGEFPTETMRQPPLST